MALYQYKKAPPKILKEVKEEKINTDENSTTLADVLDNITYSIGKKLSAVKPISFVVPFIFIFSGLVILYGQIKPYAIHYIQSKFSDKLNQEIIPLVPESYEELRSSYISDPGALYFSNLLQTKKQISQEVLQYKGTFYLSIAKIEIDNAPVIANVDSSKEKIYKEALGRGLAHFKGTDLPNGEGNVLIYGHSAAGDYAERNPQDIVTAFTRLFKLNIGDEIKIEFEDKEYRYIVKKIKEVNPEDLEILNSTGGKTLTLMTCSPPGLSAKRLVVTALLQ